jgi:serine/threonine-protein phosphatase 2A catalytic subunit
MPEPMQMSSAPASEPATIPTLDGWIESLMSCKQLAESDVQRLCEKVCDNRPPSHYPVWSIC